MIEVTAAIDGEGPNLSSQIRAARSMGSNGNSSGLPTGPSVFPVSAVFAVSALFPVSAVLLGQQFFGGLEGVERAVGDLSRQRVNAASGQPIAQRGEGQRGDLLARPGLPSLLELPGGVEPGPVRVQTARQLLDP